MIAITGDLVDSHNTNLEIALQFAEEAAKIAPCYFVTGNHEASIPEYDDLWERLTKLGVIILENERVELERSGQTITLLGVNDPSFHTNDLFGASGNRCYETQFAEINTRSGPLYDSSLS